MNIFLISIMGLKLGISQVSLILVDIIIVIGVICLQYHSFNKTRKNIKLLSKFFPNISNLEIFKSSITREILSSKKELEKFLKDLPKRTTSQNSISNTIQDVDDEYIEKQTEEFDIDLIKIKRGSNALFEEIVDETNAYLCKNVGTSADFSLLNDICERKIESLEAQISSSINVPLYLGLIGTFIGIITGVGGIAFNVEELFSSSNMSSLSALLVGVVIAMIASALGLGFMIYNSAINYKNALDECDKNRNDYYDFLRRELMPVLSNSMASSLNSLKSVLGNFIGKFGHNLDAYANSAELLNDNIEKQHLLLLEINKMNQTKVAAEIAQTFSTLKEASDSLNVFRSYQDNLNDTVNKIDVSIGKIDNIVKSFDDFAQALKIVVENQRTAKDLQTQFQAAIEHHFPIGSDARDMWRKQFDELTSDAASVSTELNNQLKASTDYIRNFADNNKESFTSLSQLKDVLNSLVEYTEVQANCYRDLKKEIEELKKAQIETRSNSNKLNADLLTAVREMISAIKTMRN